MAADRDAASDGLPTRTSPGTAAAASYRRRPKIRRVIFLVSGFGAPRNQSHAPEANSTEVTARLMKRFMESCYPEIAVRLVHSDVSIFRYDTNVNFITHHLRPGRFAPRATSYHPVNVSIFVTKKKIERKGKPFTFFVFNAGSSSYYVYVRLYRPGWSARETRWLRRTGRSGRVASSSRWRSATARRLGYKP